MSLSITCKFDLTVFVVAFFDHISTSNCTSVHPIPNCQFSERKVRLGQVVGMRCLNVC